VSADPAGLALRRRVVAGPGVRSDPIIAWRLRLPVPVTIPLCSDQDTFWVVSAGAVHHIGADGSRALDVDLDATAPVTLTAEGPVVGVADGSLLAFSSGNGKVVLAWRGSGRARGGAVPIEGGMAWMSSDGSLHSTLQDDALQLLTVAGQPASDGVHVFVHTLEGDLVATQGIAERWRARVRGPGIGAPVVGDSRVYDAWDAVGSTPGGVQAVDRETGRLLWERQLAAAPRGGLALDGSLLVPTADGTLLALDPATGEQHWSSRLGADPLSTAPLVAAGSAWVGDAGGVLHRVDLDDGGEAWSLPLGAPVTSGPELAGGTLALGLANGDLVGVEERR